MTRIGVGYDVHRLEMGRPLIIGGVRIPFDKGLVGHSDADVLAHAISDAILGAAALGDIGTHFPDTDPQYAGADSMELLRQIVSLVSEKDFYPYNVDCVVIAEIPKLSPHIAEIKERLAAVLGLSTDSIGVKATTSEGLGFTGSGEGMAAHAVCTLIEKNP
ncbi:MAG: 2-C-methyl-D-erythritol 2,4-cyclodiphosphate synthase [Nitrospinaceae bacterium]|nr:2-C-methyl-D-erythritol 2,4-cyclodiphosphate synthase [Nitrospinaceae bacterium]MBT3435056.1 2-C-methyl-D-erythritol 2,4-cyclodiphosphate synthase [Nitrospinaceae bacterium]MBT3822783.1 2-C-methyl-D-erythritol 2,4-cyclodiphosphate synthase [Nitrospinaceae bacterium]MBT4431539.1 2-C-methyl-D-erythritol 2,4-cyclodiphosphate synthase [Nitrospinaceae bacterium]MBT5368996.1 2-C-methyl-D-erythritol 2,4-cyclodiphosphate synthase [Nitrospinaceae bacterium]